MGDARDEPETKAQNPNGRSSYDRCQAARDQTQAQARKRSVARTRTRAWRRGLRRCRCRSLSLCFSRFVRGHTRTAERGSGGGTTAADAENSSTQDQHHDHDHLAGHVERCPNQSRERNTRERERERTASAFRRALSCFCVWYCSACVLEFRPNRVANSEASPLLLLLPKDTPKHPETT